MKMRIRLFHGLRVMLAAVFAFVFAVQAQAATLIDIYGPGQNQINLSMATPLTAPELPATALGSDLHKAIEGNLNFLPFMKMVPSAAILGGTVLSAWQSEGIDFRRFQIAGADLVVTAYWPSGDAENSTVELRVFETFSGKFVFGNAYAGVTKQEVANVADRFCDDLMYALTGGRGFFSSTVAFVKGDGQKRDVWLVRPTGRDLRQVTDLPGTALSPSWSPDGRYVVFSHRDDRTYALGVWDRLANKVTRIRFPGNTVIGPCFLPDNRVAVSLSTSR